MIEANRNVPLLAATGNAARGAGKVVNPHLSGHQAASIAQVNNVPANWATGPGQRQDLHRQCPRLRRLRQSRRALAKLTQTTCA